MFHNEVKCDKLTKNIVLCRASLRGLKKCTSCGYITGQRALICRNENCDLRIKRLAAIKPFDPIQLVTFGRTKLYSLRSKEKLLQPRNFVSITETREQVESLPCLICYVHNCKYDAFEPTHLVCRHIKACKVLTDVTQADVYPIDKSILWNLNISVEQKLHLWHLYQLEEKQIPPIQKLNSSIFVVKCVESKMFPAGRLHVTVFSNKIPNKSGNFSCSCKKLKIILEPDNSVCMKQEICDHLLLLLAAILNKPDGKTLYGKFLDALQYLWMPTSLNTPIVDCTARPSQYMDYDLDLGKCKESIKVDSSLVSDNANDIFNFAEELFAENNIPDFSDVILDVKNYNVTNNVQEQQTPALEMHKKDPKLNATTASINDEDIDLNFGRIKTPQPEILYNTTQIAIDFNENSGLSVIEQFQLNHNMQVSNDNMELAKDIENLNNLDTEVMESANILPVNINKQTSLLKNFMTINNNNHNNNRKDIESNPSLSIKSDPATELAQKSIVLKQGPVKIIKIATPIQKWPFEQKNKIVQASQINSNKIIVLKSNQSDAKARKYVSSAVSLTNHIANQSSTSNVMPLLSYEAWLDHIIELINESIIIQDSNTIKSIFHVHETIFNYFSKTFALNNKRRLPNTTSVMKTGKYKDLIKYTWYFNQASTVQRIFSGKNIKIELERCYQRLNDGNFELYIPEKIKLTDNNNFRPIYPKIQLYKVFVQFSNNPETSSTNLQSQKCGLKLEWLPSAFPKSNFGLMTIEFYVSVKRPEESTL